MSEKQEYGVDILTYDPKCLQDVRFLFAFHTNNDCNSGTYGERFIVIPERIGRGWMIAQFTIEKFSDFTFQYHVKISSEDLGDGYIVAADDAEQIDMQAVFDASDIAFIQQVVLDVIVPEIVVVRDFILQSLQDS